MFFFFTLLILFIIKQICQGKSIPFNTTSQKVDGLRFYISTEWGEYIASICCDLHFYIYQFKLYIYQANLKNTIK